MHGALSRSGAVSSRTLACKRTFAAVEEAEEIVFKPRGVNPRVPICLDEVTSAAMHDDNL